MGVASVAPFFIGGLVIMPQIGSDENPMMFRKTFASKESRFRKKFNKEAYDFNYDRIFNKEPKNEFEACRAKSKTFSMEQD
tara:strand:+ start:3061 stop:3303 length:243 start_codon:yes stop_codon:yes gene_type:complete